MTETVRATVYLQLEPELHHYSPKVPETKTAVEWLSVRSHVAGIVKGTNPRMEPSTSVRIAERLLAEGVVDVASVAEALRPEPPSEGGGPPHALDESESVHRAEVSSADS